MNELLRCCDAPWSPHQLEVENVGDVGVTIDVTARFVHDDLAVMVDGAESGTRLSILLLGGLWVLLLRRARRRGGALEPSSRRAAVSGTLAVAVVIGVAIFGQVRYGVGGAPALVAGGGNVPLVPSNPIVSRASLLIALAIVGFGAVGRSWAAMAVSAPPRVYVTTVPVLALLGGVRSRGTPRRPRGATGTNRLRAARPGRGTR